MDKNRFLELVAPYDNVIFDYGGIIVDINYQLTVNKLKSLGTKIEIGESYDKAHQVEFFDNYEKGLISSDEFLALLAKEYNIPKSMRAKISSAWCEMLLEIPYERVEFLNQLKKTKRIFMLSNINEIHEKHICEYISKNPKISDLYEQFEKVFFSHHIGRRKPHIETFEYVLKDLGIDPSKTLFIDDSIQHIKGAKSAGLNVYHLDPANTFITKIIEKQDQQFSHVLIDNDKLMHLSWSMAAKKLGVELSCFISFDSFLVNKAKYSNDCVFYIDSDLGIGEDGEEMKGEVLSEQLSDLGFKNLYLATGFKAKDFKKPSWILEVLGKRPTFKNNN